MELRQYANVLIKWWWLILAAAGVASAAAFVGSLATPRTYLSRTTLMVGQALQSPNPNQGDIYIGQALAESYSDLVKREPVLRGALEALGLNWNWGVLQSMVSSRVVPGTQLLEVSVLDTEPDRARVIADEIARQLILQSPAGANSARDAERQFTLTQIENIKSNIDHAQQEIVQLDDTIAKAASARQIQDARTRQAELQTQVSTWQATYAQLLTNLQQGTTNFLSIVEPASASNTPVGASTMSNMLLAALIAVVLASSAAYLLEYIDDTIKSADDVQSSVALATLGTVARIDEDDDMWPLVTLHHPRSPIAEMYRRLRTNIQFSTVDNSMLSIMVASANPGEGKSLTAANLAIAIAQTGKRVILVDTDLRRPVQNQIFSLPNQMGLTSILLDPDVRLSDVLQTVGIDNLRVMTSGPIPLNPSEILGSKRMGYLIETLRREADVTIFDSPPIMAVTDSTVLGARLDGTVMIVDAGRTRRIHVQRSKQALSAVGARMLGVVINRVSKPSAGYSSYYYAEDEDSRHPIETPRSFIGRIRRIVVTRGHDRQPERSELSKSNATSVRSRSSRRAAPSDPR